MIKAKRVKLARKREKKMRKMIARGYSLADIGRKMGFSRERARQLKNDYGIEDERKCKGCGKKVEDMKYGTRYCSKACRWTHNNRRYRRLVTQECVYCKKEFSFYQGIKKVKRLACSRECYKKYAYRMRGENGGTLHDLTFSRAGTLSSERIKEIVMRNCGAGAVWGKMPSTKETACVINLAYIKRLRIRGDSTAGLEKLVKEDFNPTGSTIHDRYVGFWNTLTTTEGGLD